MTISLTDIPGLRVTVMGLGTRGGGTGVARFFAEQGAEVTVTDLRSAETLAAAMEPLVDLPIRYVLEQHDERDFLPTHTDLVIRNPAVPRKAPLLELARAQGLPVHMELSLFLALCPAASIGITGTKGKTSTAYLTSHILRQWRSDTVLAGNMGVSALDQLQFVQEVTPVVLEISNWQLEGNIEHHLSPTIAVLTNVSEDHLNTYSGFAEYANVKRQIGTWSPLNGGFIVNADCEPCSPIEPVNGAPIFRFSQSGPAEVMIEGNELIWELGGLAGSASFDRISQFSSPYQRMNAAAAVAAAVLRGASEEHVQQALATFTGVPDRNEFVADIDGVTFINDTAATAPAAVAAVVEGLPGRRLHLIAGGSDKKVDLNPLADLLASRAATVTLLDGNATATLAAMLDTRGKHYAGPVQTMAAAVRMAATDAHRGDIVILSPGCASFGLFRDEFDRGQQFREAVRALAASNDNGARV